LENNGFQESFYSPTKGTEDRREGGRERGRKQRTERGI
jgi:hypothetical protein